MLHTICDIPYDISHILSYWYDFLTFFSAHPSEVAKCNTQTGHWVQKQGKCRPKWEPKCDIPSTQKGGYWNCATMLTDPKAPREAELPELHDVTGLTTADLVSRNVGMTERWYAEPELGKILIYFHTNCVICFIIVDKKV